MRSATLEPETELEGVPPHPRHRVRTGLGGQEEAYLLVKEGGEWKLTVLIPSTLNISHESSYTGDTMDLSKKLRSVLSHVRADFHGTEPVVRTTELWEIFDHLR
jgi:hypothetical protein